MFAECTWHCKDSGLGTGASSCSTASQTHIPSHTHTHKHTVLLPPQPSLWMMSLKLIAVPFSWHAWGGFLEARTVQSQEKAAFKGQLCVRVCLCVSPWEEEFLSQYIVFYIFIMSINLIQLNDVTSYTCCLLRGIYCPVIILIWLTSKTKQQFYRKINQVLIFTTHLQRYSLTLPNMNFMSNHLWVWFIF